MTATADAATPGAEPSAAGFDPATMTKDERSIVLYLETCLVDAGGLVEGVRMNDADHEAIGRLSEAGLLRVYRIPAAMLGTGGNPRWTHIACFASAGWGLAHQLRRKRAEQVGPYATSVIAELTERGKWRAIADTTDPLSRSGKTQDTTNQSLKQEG